MSNEECFSISRCPVYRSSESIPSALFPSSFDIRCSIFCGSLPRLPNAAVDRRIPHCNPLKFLQKLSTGPVLNWPGS